MRPPTHQDKNANLAIGYVRVSTQEQAQDGVSLDIQRDKIRAYCKSNDLRLIDIKADEGISGGTMERPALQAALAALDRGQANTLIVVKLDRLTRSVKDLCQLVDKYFSHEQYHLLSICGMINTHTAAGRMMMLNLANYAQFERELIRERTQEAINHLKAQNVRLGCPPYGHRYSQKLDAHGRRILVEDPEQLKVLRRMAELRRQGYGLTKIARLLNSEGIPAQRGGPWHSTSIMNILSREGSHTKWRRPKRERICDIEVSTARARELRAQGLSLRQIAARLTEEHHIPQRAREWHGATVRGLLRRPVGQVRKSAAEVARELRNQGMSLRQIGRALTAQDYRPVKGGSWHAATVMTLLAPP